MILHPVAAWRQQLGLSHREVYRRYAQACRRRGLQPRKEGTLRNAIDGRDALGPVAAMALAEATDGAVTVEQILEYHMAKAQLAPK